MATAPCLPPVPRAGNQRPLTARARATRHAGETEYGNFIAHTRRPLIAGNWKMNGLKSAAGVQFEAMIAGAGALAGKADLLVCPPATLIAGFADKARRFKTRRSAAQDCHPKASGAHTGDLSAEMLADAGASAIIVGHSERRADHGETDALVRQKAEAAWRAGLLPSSASARPRSSAMPARRWISAGAACGIVPDGATAANLVVAYEPVWAIGTGLTPTTRDVAAAHAHIRKILGGLMGNAAATDTSHR